MIPNKIFHYLSIRARTEKQIREYIQKNQISEENQIVSRLKELNYVNDSEFAKSYARTKLKSNKLLEYELRQKGINIKLENDDLVTAKKLYEKRRFKSREQAIRFLQSRGFSWGTILAIMPKDYDQ